MRRNCQIWKYFSGRCIPL